MDSKPHQRADTSASSTNPAESPPTEPIGNSFPTMNANTTGATAQPGQKGYVFVGGLCQGIIEDIKRRNPEAYERMRYKGWDDLMRQLHPERFSEPPPETPSGNQE